MEITASEAARRFSDILDAVEHRGGSSVPIEEDDLDVARAHAPIARTRSALRTPGGAHDLLIAATSLARTRMALTTDREGFSDLPGVRFRMPR